MTEGLAFEPAGSGADARVLGTVADIFGATLAVGILGGAVLIGDADDIVGLSWEFRPEQVEQLAQLVVRATWEAARHT